MLRGVEYRMTKMICGVRLVEWSSVFWESVGVVVKIENMALQSLFQWYRDIINQENCAGLGAGSRAKKKVVLPKEIIGKVCEK